MKQDDCDGDIVKGHYSVNFPCVCFFSVTTGAWYEFVSEKECFRNFSSVNELDNELAKWEEAEIMKVPRCVRLAKRDVNLKAEFMVTFCGRRESFNEFQEDKYEERKKSGAVFTEFELALTARFSSNYLKAFGSPIILHDADPLVDIWDVKNEKLLATNHHNKCKGLVKFLHVMSSLTTCNDFDAIRDEFNAGNWSCVFYS